MRYKLDNAGYICAVSFGCYLDNCNEYTGAVPVGYNNLDEWASIACIQAYYLDEKGNLTLDSKRKTELENRQSQEAIDYAPLVRKDLYETNEVLDSQYTRNRVSGKVITLEDIKTISPICIITGIQAYECKKIRLLTQGKNMLNCTAKTVIFSGVGFGVNPDGSLTVTGKATEDIEYIIAENDYLFSLKANEKYHLNLGGLNCELRYSNNGEIAQQYIGSSGLITVPNNIEVSQVVLKIPSGQSVNTTFHPQLECGGSFTSYESYKCKVTEIDLSPHLADALFPEETLYPSDTLFPQTSTTINYIMIKDGSIVVSIDGIPTVIGSGTFGLFSDYSTIYADKDVMLEVEYSTSLLDVESLEFLQGKSTTTNQFKILKDGSIEAHNGYFSGRIEADSGYFKGEISWKQITDNDDVATKSFVENQGYQNATQVTKITKDTVTTSFVNALNVKAGSVDAENITGTTIKGKKLEGITGEIGGFTIGSNSLHAGFKDYLDSNLTGVYVGTDGISVGVNAFKVTADGDIYLGYQNDIITQGGINFKALTYSKIKYDGTELMAFDKYKTTFSKDIVMNSCDIVMSGLASYIKSSNITGYHIKFDSNRVTIGNYYNVIGESNSFVGFFGSDGAKKKTVSSVSTTATTSTVATKLNELIDALKAYNLIG